MFFNTIGDRMPHIGQTHLPDFLAKRDISKRMKTEFEEDRNIREVVSLSHLSGVARILTLTGHVTNALSFANVVAILTSCRHASVAWALHQVAWACARLAHPWLRHCLISFLHNLGVQECCDSSSKYYFLIVVKIITVLM